MLETLRCVYHNETMAREQGLSPQDRLRFHQEHSDPVLVQTGCDRAMMTECNGLFQ
jgi:hypothetical protein